MGRTGLILAATALFTADAAAAQGRNCAPRMHVVERLEQRYGETRQSAGLAANQQMLEVWASRDTGTWTILMTSASGLTCLVATGEAFEGWTSRPEPEGDPA